MKHRYASVRLAHNIELRLRDMVPMEGVANTALLKTPNPRYLQLCIGPNVVREGLRLALR